MQETLLSTKLCIPPARSTSISRPGLLASLAKAENHALTLVSAPPGYGKTTLVSGWLRDQPAPYAWLSLDEGDNDPVRFLAYFLTALHAVVPAIRPDRLDLLQGSQSSSFETLLTLLFNEISSAGSFFLVLDDFHVIRSEPILQLTASLLDQAPAPMHLVLLSRADPPLPLSRLRARGRLLEVRGAQLRFSSAETARFFHEAMGLNLPEAACATLEARTEGWIAGLQLAALAMQGEQDTGTFISAFTGSHAYILDYLTEELLNRQPEEIRGFLLRTSILERMCAPLCDALLGERESRVESREPSREGLVSAPHAGYDSRLSILDSRSSPSILEHLERSILFVVPLDNERRWYRYHHLFKDVLERRLEAACPQLIPELHWLASGWYEENGLPRDAIHHALKSGDRDRAVRLVEHHGCDLLMAGELISLDAWLSAIDPYIQTHPWLAMQKAWVLLLSGHPERAGQMIDAGEQLLAALPPDGETRTMQGSFAAARALLANLQGKTGLAVEHAQQSLGFLSESGDFSCSLRSVATSLLGDAGWMSGKMDDARAAYSDAVRIGQAAGNPHTEMISANNLADVLVEQGRLRQAAKLFSDTLQLACKVDGPDSPYAHPAHFGLSRVWYASNRLEEAALSLQQCGRLARQWRDANLQAGCLVLSARLELVRGSIEKAQAAMNAAEEWAGAQSLSPRWSMWVQAELARFWLSQGKCEKALDLVHSHGVWTGSLASDPVPSHDVRFADPIPYRLEAVYLVLLRLLLAQGLMEAALTLCERLLADAQAGGRWGTVTEVLVLQALAYQSMKDTPGALAALEKAVALAAPEGSRRLFLDEGRRMAELIYQARARGAGGEFAADLLPGFIEPAVSNAPVESGPIRDQSLLIEPLSAREMEVLECIAKGYSNQEIAERFVISPKTVKRHISNIYAKLEAKNRTQAVALARELKILD